MVKLSIHTKRKFIISSIIITILVGICIRIFSSFSTEFNNLIMSIVYFNTALLTEITLSFLLHRESWKDDNWKRKDDRYWL